MTASGAEEDVTACSPPTTPLLLFIGANSKGKSDSGEETVAAFVVDVDVAEALLFVALLFLLPTGLLLCCRSAFCAAVSRGAARWAAASLATLEQMECGSEVDMFDAVSPLEALIIAPLRDKDVDDDDAAAAAEVVEGEIPDVKAVVFVVVLVVVITGVVFVGRLIADGKMSSSRTPLLSRLSTDALRSSMMSCAGDMRGMRDMIFVMNMSWGHDVIKKEEEEFDDEEVDCC